MSNKTLVVVAIALGIAVVLMINSKFNELESRAEPPQTVFYKARVDIEPGLTVQGAGGEGFLEVVRGIPQAFADQLPEAIDLKEYEGHAKNKRIERRVEAGEFLMFRHLDPVIGDEVMVAIPEGHIAFSFPVTNTSSVSYLISPGDTVDVYRIAIIPDGEAEGGVARKAIRVAEDMVIFAVDAKVAVGGGESADRGQAYRTVTVTGPSKAIEELMVDAASGPLQLALKARKLGS